jgi:hypothetical protein
MFARLILAQMPPRQLNRSSLGMTRVNDFCEHSTTRGRDTILLAQYGISQALPYMPER